MKSRIVKITVLVNKDHLSLFFTFMVIAKDNYHKYVLNSLNYITQAYF